MGFASGARTLQSGLRCHEFCRNVSDTSGMWETSRHSVLSMHDSKQLFMYMGGQKGATVKATVRTYIFSVRLAASAQIHSLHI